LQKQKERRILSNKGKNTEKKALKPLKIYYNQSMKDYQYQKKGHKKLNINASFNLINVRRIHQDTIKNI
jgi:hypothetical protein